MTGKRKILVIYMGLVIAAVCLIFGVYSIIDATGNSGDANLEARGIDSPLKALLNGYLGQFFRFRYLGNINWIAIPILGYLIFTFKKRSQTEKAFLFMYCTILAIVSIKGFFNFRYTITLFPITIALISYYLWKWMEDEKVRFLRIPTFVFMGLLVVLNTYHYFSFAKSKAKEQTVKTEKIKHETKTEDKHKKSKVAQLISLFKDNKIVNLKSDAAFVLDMNKTPVQLMEYIEKELRPNDIVLNNNMPLLYYATNKKGIYYWCEDDYYYTPTGHKYLFKDRTKDEVLSFLTNELKCTYILTLSLYNKYNEDFEELLKNNTELVFEEHEYQLYKIVQ